MYGIYSVDGLEVAGVRFAAGRDAPEQEKIHIFIA
jgi:hypothetical protein